METSGEEQQLMTDGSKMMIEKGPEADVMLAGDRDSKKQRRSCAEKKSSLNMNKNFLLFIAKRGVTYVRTPGITL